MSTQEERARVFEQRRTGGLAASDRGRQIAAAQGIFYIVSGAWPLVSMRTFEMVTGRKTNKWLVKTAGALIAVIGTTLLVDARRTDGPVTRKVLGMGSAGALAAIDLIYTSAGRIPKVYLLDALLELGIVGAWTWFSD